MQTANIKLNKQRIYAGFCCGGCNESPIGQSSSLFLFQARQTQAFPRHPPSPTNPNQNMNSMQTVRDGETCISNASLCFEEAQFTAFKYVLCCPLPGL